MSWNDTHEPTCLDVQCDDLIVAVIEPRARDIGGFEVRRTLPSLKRRTVGPFVFFDEMGPAEFDPGKGIDVRPHPHIGLATVTYLFEGEIEHRDSLGTHQTIRPGQVNWMIAGRAITHSERTGAALRAAGHTLHGIQVWVALPVEAEDMAPAFEHFSDDALPVIDKDGVSIRVILGEAFGVHAPAQTLSPTLYADCRLTAGSALALPDNHDERAIYIVDGAVRCGDKRFETGQMVVFKEKCTASISSQNGDARLILLGGAPLEGKRHISWNFVSSSPDKIKAAENAWREGDWKHGLFTLPPNDDDEHIPLPE